MKPFDYVRPATVAEAVAAAAQPGAAYLAAGTNLLDLMKGGVSRPDLLVDVTHLDGLDAIETLADGSLRIGALVSNADLAHDPAFARTYPAVAEALLSGASAQLRNAATVGVIHLTTPRTPALIRALPCRTSRGAAPLPVAPPCTPTARDSQP